MQKFKEVKEGGVFIKIMDGVFYNPKMEINRDLLIAVLQCLNIKEFCDAHTATGIKAIRASSENDCISKICCVDLSKKACKNAAENARINGINDIKIINADIRKHLLENNYEFVEIDPFGSPAPYVCSLADSCSWRRSGYFSLTATDTAVLCGAEHKACVRIYGAAPLHKEIVHEIGLRILTQFVQKMFAQKNLAVLPILSISHRHYLKIFFRFNRDANKCNEIIKNISYFAYCDKCRNRRYINIGESRICERCGNKMLIAGPVWRGLLHDSKLAECCIRLIEQRKYNESKEEISLLKTIVRENFDGVCYDLHTVFKGEQIPKTSEVIAKLRNKGYCAEITSYGKQIIRTNAGISQIKEN